MDEGKGGPIEAELAERVGTLIHERYRVLRVIGHGSTGAVYACQHVGLDKLVALKVLHREMEQNASFVDRFKLEAQAASRLEHPNSVRVLDFGQDPANGALFIAMEYIEGRDLLQVLEEDGPFTAERAVDVMSQILDVLGVAHAAGIVHRDLKPENILLRAVEIDGVMREHVTVCDFGIAQFGGRRSAAADGSAAQNAPNAQGNGGSPDGEEGLVAGTPAYMSPEQARAEPQDARSDVYSAGVVLYQLLTLQLPFYSDDAYALALKHCVEVPPPPSRFGAVSPQLEEICLKALSKSRDARYQSAREMRQSLQRVLFSESSLADGGRPRRWGLPRPIAPQGTPSDAPAVDLRPAHLSAHGHSNAHHAKAGPQRAALFGRLTRWSLAGAAALGCVMCAGVFISHNQDQRAQDQRVIPAGAHSARASNAAQSRGQASVASKRVTGSAPRSVASPASAPLASGAPSAQLQSETSYSAVTAVSAAGAELPEAQVSLPSSEKPSDEGSGGSASAGAASKVATKVATGPVQAAEAETLVVAQTANREGSRRSAVKSDAVQADSRENAESADSSKPSGRIALRTVAAVQDDKDNKDSNNSKHKPGEAQGRSALAHARSQRADLADDAPVDAAVSDALAERPISPEAHLETLALGLLPDSLIDTDIEALTALEPAAPAQPTSAQPTSAQPTSAQRTAGATLVSHVSLEQEEEAEGEEAAPVPSTPTVAVGSARVAITKIAPRSGVSRSSVRGALNLGAITDCYRSAIRDGGISGRRVVGELELATSQNGGVTEASLTAPELPTPLRQCVEQIVRRGRVREADTGSAQATITLAFVPR